MIQTKRSKHAFVWLVGGSFLLMGHSRAQQADPCNNQCENGALCVAGAADFSNHSTYDGSTLEIHAETSLGNNNNYHCECPYGWTGVRCDIIYDSCQQEVDGLETEEHHHDTNGHKCYHGGQCIPGLRDEYGHEQLFCDCSQAKDASTGDQYIGKYCEHRAVNYCNDNDGNFCLNGGECNQNYPGQGPACLCLEGHEGKHCEFKSGSVPHCDLDCQNGGQCVLGQGPGTITEDISHYWDDTPNQDNNLQHMYCSCPEGYDGPQCDIIKEPCGKDYCYHGSSCVTDDFYCDCASANTHNDRNSYAGRYCEYEATTYCSKSGDVFCVNGGSCADIANPHQGCTCPDGWMGFSCEFQVPPADFANTLLEQQFNKTTIHHTIISGINDEAEDDEDDFDDLDARYGNEQGNIVLPWEPSPETSTNEEEDGEYMVCDLQCANGGTCRKGRKNYGDDLTEIIKDIDHLNITTSEDFDHCVCPQGYIGLSCEHQVDICGNGEHHCLHGSQCVPNTIDLAEEQYRCDCSTTTSNASSLVEHPVFAGTSCEHKATDICTIMPNDKGSLETTMEGGVGIGPARPMSFCVNGGSCLRQVTTQEEHPGCNCPGGWEGPHCELKIKHHPYHEDDITEPPEEFFEEQELQNAPSFGEEEDEEPEDFFEEQELQSAPSFGEEDPVSITRICNKVNTTLREAMSFCVNGGTCVRIVEHDEDHPGCICPGRWGGPHCEVNMDEIEVVPGSAYLPYNRRGPVQAIIIVLSASIMVILVLLLISKRRRQDSRNKSTTNLANSSNGNFFTGYRDEPSTSSSNLAPARDVAVDPIPNRRFPSSSSSSGMIMMTGMASSDSTPNARVGGGSSSSGGASIASTVSSMYSVDTGMAPSDSTPVIGNSTAAAANRRSARGDPDEDSAANSHHTFELV